MWRLVADGSGAVLLAATFLGLLLNRVRVILEKAAGVVRAWHDLRQALRSLTVGGLSSLAGEWW
jgi:hypothetical protein